MKEQSFAADEWIVSTLWGAMRALRRKKEGEWNGKKGNKTFPSLLELLQVSVVDDERMKAMSGRKIR